MLTKAEQRASFEVLALDELPAIVGVELRPSKHGACCLHCEADWPRIAGAAVQWLESGRDPLDRTAIERHARRLGLDVDSTRWLLSLFKPWDAIVWLRRGGQFVNGQHRLHALRAAGVERCVVYTGRGERPHRVGP